MKSEYCGRKAKKEEMKGRIIGTKDIIVGDVIIGGLSKDFYEVVGIIDENYITTINLSNGEEKRTNPCLKEGRGHYEWFNYKKKVSSIAEDW